MGLSEDAINARYHNISYGKYMANIKKVHIFEKPKEEPPKGKKLICPVCNKEFYSARWNKVYCSDECKMKHDSKEQYRKYHNLPTEAKLEWL